jgi:citronellyl-CoA dehydrogenase
MIYTAEHLAMQRAVEQFIDKEINPHIDAWEEAGMFPAHEVFSRMGSLGFLGVCMPTAYGGMGLDYSYGIAVAEALGHIACVGVADAIGVQTDMATPALARFGSETLKNEFLVPSITGEYVACIGVTEPHAGSDVAHITTTARKDGDDYVINGSKMFITNGTQADWMCMLANTSDAPAHTNKSLICVPMRAPGITIARKLDKLGMHSSDTALIYFDDVRVPQRNRIGEEGKGFIYQMQQFQEERMWIAAKSLRMMERAIQQTIVYTKERQAFGHAVLDNQVVQFRLAELQTEIEALRGLVYLAVDKYVGGEDVTPLASMAKLKAGRLLRVVADNCLQYYGGIGFMSDMPISRFYRDCRITSIGGGTDEIMLQIIAKHMGMRQKKQT